MEIALALFKEFIEVNDPYVMEGILSAIHGAVAYSENSSGLKALALEIDNQIFNQPETEEIYPMFWFVIMLAILLNTLCKKMNIHQMILR